MRPKFILEFFMKDAEIQEVIGELLAAGNSDADIVDTLVENEKLSHDEACTCLRSVYDSWQHTRDTLNLNENNLIDWHVFLRRSILEKAIKAETVASLRLALSVLDSLATIQGICAAQGQTMPLTITLVEKKEEESDNTEVEQN